MQDWNRRGTSDKRMSALEAEAENKQGYISFLWECAMPIWAAWFMPIE